MSKPPITVEDMNRLLTEQIGTQVHPRDWFEKNGFDPDIDDLLIKAGRAGFVDLLMVALADSDDRDPRKMFGDICATFLLSGFSLGWECRKQFGGGHG